MIKNLKIRTKLVILVSILILFIGLVGTIGFRSMEAANAALDTIFHDRVEALGQIKAISDALSNNIVDTVHQVRSGAKSFETGSKDIQDANDIVEKQWKDYLDTTLAPEEEKLVQVVKKQLVPANEAIKTLQGILERKNKAELEKFANDSLYQNIGPVTDTYNELADLQIRVAHEVFNGHVESAVRDQKIMIALIIAAVLFGLGFAAYLIQMITRPIIYAHQAITRMAAGELNVEIVDDGLRDEAGMIITATAAIASTLKAVDRDLRMQIKAASEGSLSVRADSTVHPGGFAEIVEGVNQLFDTLTEPMHEIASVMARLASGDIRGRMTGEYQGELRALKGNVNRSLDALVALLDAIAAFSVSLAGGDLTFVIEGAFQGEFASIKQNLNAAVDQLKAVLVEVIDTTANVSISAEQTTAASSEVSRHASNQMLTLTEVSGAIEQTVAAITEIAASAERGNSLARNAVSAAEGGRTTLVALTETVHSIAEKNKKITQISELIANIADKTYVLALNAGLEAARAGEHGSGFGLIAHKITTLAEEVADATRSIRGLILEATESVQLGVDGANVAQSSIHSIVDLSQQNGMTVQTIAAAIEEQSSMMQVLKERVHDLKTVGQTTASAAEEISATMKSLSLLAQHLKSEADRIRTA